MNISNKAEHPDNKPRKSLLWVGLAGLVLALIVMLAVVFYVRLEKVKARRQAELGQQEARVNVVTYTVAPRSIRDRINLPGTIDPWVKLEVVSQVAGEVLEKKAREGAVVDAGEVLARIDSRKYQNAYDSAKASLETALASQKRLSELYREELASKSDLDAINATVENYRAAMENAALDLEHCLVRAPIAGIVNRVFIDTGQVLAPGQEVAEVLQIDPVKVSVGIPESDMPAVRKLTDFTVTVGALGDKRFSGKKHFLSKTADPMARLYTLEILLDNPAAEILPDMFARVEIVKRTVADAVVLPLYAVTANDEQTVMVEKDGVVHQRTVTLGIVEGFNVQITFGLDFGENVVIMGQKQVADGQKVTVVRNVSDPAMAMQ